MFVITGRDRNVGGNGWRLEIVIKAELIYLSPRQKRK